MKPEKRRKRLRQYVGTLTPKEAAEGIAAADETALALLQDAELLLEHGRWARAAALASLAIEEANKARMIHRVLLAETDRERREAWRQYRSHTGKNLTYIIPLLVYKGARTLNDLAALYDPSSSHAENLEVYKQLALYSEAKGTDQCSWSKPSTHATERMANAIMFAARIVVGPVADPVTTEAQLAFYARYVKSVGKGTAAVEGRRVIVDCYVEGEKAGIYAKGAAREIAEFLGMMDYFNQPRS